MHKTLWFVLIAAPTAFASSCECSRGALSVQALADVMGCSSRAVTIATSVLQHCADIPDNARNIMVAKIAECKRTDEPSPHCELAVGPRTWVVIVMTACTYISVLAVAISLRPEITNKCD